MKRLKIKKLININLYWLGLSFMWSSIHPIILPAVLLHLVPEQLKNTYLGLITFVGLILAMIVTPISGTASDNWRSRWGRRRPLAVLGTAGDFIFLALLAWSGNILVVIIGYVGLQITSNIAHGPMQGLIPDLVPEEQLGAASGMKNLMDMGGLIGASLAAGNFMPADAENPLLIMLVVMCVLAATATATFLLVKEKSSESLAKSESEGISLEHFRTLLKINPEFFEFILSRFLFLVGVYGVQTFAQYYIRDVMQAENPVQATGDLMAVLAISLVVFAVIAGWLTDRTGPKMILVAASIFTAVGSGLLIFASDMLQLKIFGSIFGAGIGLFLTANWALASQLAPKSEAGKYLGMTNLATAGASAASKLFGIPIDWINKIYPGEYRGYNVLFLTGSIFAVISLIYLIRNNKKKGKIEIV
jgi:Na+/melibiose symporter-like transporter